MESTEVIGLVNVFFLFLFFTISQENRKSSKCNDHGHRKLATFYSLCKGHGLDQPDYI